MRGSGGDTPSSLLAHNPNPDMPRQADLSLIGAQVINLGLFPPHPASPPPVSRDTISAKHHQPAQHPNSVPGPHPPFRHPHPFHREITTHMGTSSIRQHPDFSTCSIPAKPPETMGDTRNSSLGEFSRHGTQFNVLWVNKRSRKFIHPFICLPTHPFNKCLRFWGRFLLSHSS